MSTFEALNKSRRQVRRNIEKLTSQTQDAARPMPRCHKSSISRRAKNKSLFQSIHAERPRKIAANFNQSRPQLRRARHSYVPYIETAKSVTVRTGGAEGRAYLPILPTKRASKRNSTACPAITTLERSNSEDECHALSLYLWAAM